jgi:hypothetical protein
MRTTSASRDGVEITVTAPTQAGAGTRLWVDAVVRNEGDATVYWAAASCTTPVNASARPSSSPIPDASRPGEAEEEPRWDGDVGGLGRWLAEHNTLSDVRYAQRANTTGRRTVACTREGPHPEPVEPGGEVRYRGSVELRVPPGELRDGGRYELVLSFLSYPDTNVLGDGVPVEVRSPLVVTDDPQRAPRSADDAVAAFAADPRLADWIASTDVPGRPDLVQDFGTELSWWRGAWELWVDAYWDDDRPLRMRYDPARGEVVDVRTVSMNQAPEDEPGRFTISDEEPDEVLRPR